jgi:hypothetical protein
MKKIAWKLARFLANIRYSPQLPLAPSGRLPRGPILRRDRLDFLFALARAGLAEKLPKKGINEEFINI